MYYFGANYYNMPKLNKIIRRYGIQDQKPSISKKRSDSRKIYDSKMWRHVVRPRKLVDNPFCEMCERHGIYNIATDVDHIKPISNGGSPFDFDNLQSLCKRCHSQKTNKDQRS